MSKRPFHLAWFLQGSSVQAWGEPWTGHIGTTWEQPALFLDMARCLERACFDYILLEDSSYVGESYNGSTEVYLKNAIAVPRQDPSVVAALMTQVTSRIGIVLVTVVPLLWVDLARRRGRWAATASGTALRCGRRC
jgi:alkanesulfonate monooxygenase SsuD/methylene tetrahydromethanopterin reductase-like flavin-dependent oxidoreductase (luciferase family)